MKNAKYSITLIGFVSLMLAYGSELNAQSGSTVKDQEGNIYNTIQTGKLTWMVENLRTTSLNDGTPILLITDNTEWSQSSIPAYCWYSNDTLYKNIYGALYNGYALFSGKLCPTGWHVSTDSDWSYLIDNSGGENVAGGMLKEPGTSHWESPNTTTNETGFSALPGGSRFKNGLFITVKRLGYWWSPMENNKYSCWYRSIYYKDIIVSRNFTDSTNGFSVRCVKD